MGKLEHIAASLREAADELTRMAQEDKLAYTAAEIAPIVNGDGQHDTVPAPPVRTTWLTVSKAFEHRYRQKYGLEWHREPHRRDLEEIAQWLDTHDDPKAAGARLLDNWFETDWAWKVDYKPRFLNENVTAVYQSNHSKAEQDSQNRARDAENARIRHEIARARAEVDQAAKAGRAPSTADLDMTIAEVRSLVGEV